MTLPPAFFLPTDDADTFVATELTRGPWNDAHQHGGPPSALMARAAERYGDDPGRFFLVRLTVDYLRPIHIVPLRVEVEPLKLGRSAERLQLGLWHEGEVVARALALRIRRLDASTTSASPPPLPPPDDVEPFVFPFFENPVGYQRGIEGRYVRGRFGENNVTVWARQTAPLVDGEAPSGWQRVVLVADAESGLCNPLDIRTHAFVNPDLTVVLDREPRGEWIGLDALSTASPLGIGIAQSALYDLDGAVGRSAQTLVVQARDAAAPR